MSDITKDAIEIAERSIEELVERVESLPVDAKKQREILARMITILESVIQTSRELDIDLGDAVDGQEPEGGGSIRA